MSICGICKADISDGKPFDEEHLSYDGCENGIDIDDKYRCERRW